MSLSEAAGQLKLPRHVRFVSPAGAGDAPPTRAGGDGGVEIPYDDGAHGSWLLEDEAEPDALGARTVTFDVARAGDPTLRFSGLYDGERIAGPLVLDAGAGAGTVVGEFLCTRLFSFWGTPNVAAGRPGAE